MDKSGDVGDLPTSLAGCLSLRSLLLSLQLHIGKLPIDFLCSRHWADFREEQAERRRDRIYVSLTIAFPQYSTLLYHLRPHLVSCPLSRFRYRSNQGCSFHRPGATGSSEVWIDDDILLTLGIALQTGAAAIVTYNESHLEPPSKGLH
jgi:hypothetical protein